MLRDCANVANWAKYFHSTSQYFLDTVEAEAVISTFNLNYWTSTFFADAEQTHGTKSLIMNGACSTSFLMSSGTFPLTAFPECR